MQTKDELVAALRGLAAERGVTTVTKAAFRKATGISDKSVAVHFTRWRDACAAAGVEPGSIGRVADETIFAAMRDAFLACGGIVARHAFDRECRVSRTLLDRRFGGWAEALAAFADWASRCAPDFPYRDALAMEAAARPKGARDFGEPIGYRGLFHAPMNEMGVVLAFGVVADALGFGVETVSTAFPDCTAKRRVADGRWRAVRIEFEYRSRNFRDHRHDPTGCDLIVCWEHDWPDCPVEVLELKSAIAGLRG